MTKFTDKRQYLNLIIDQCMHAQAGDGKIHLPIRLAPASIDTLKAFEMDDEVWRQRPDVQLLRCGLMFLRCIKIKMLALCDI